MRVVVGIVILLVTHELLVAQCNLQPQLTFPNLDRSRSNSYGYVTDSFGDFMVVAEHANDSLDFDAGIVHLYQLSGGAWSRIAVLAPSDPQEFMNFGFYLSINESTIAVVGNRYDVDGNRRERIYIFEQDNNGTWNSGTESYQIEVSQETHYLIWSIDLSSNYLAVAFEENFNNDRIGIFRYDPGQFTFIQHIDGPLDVDGSNRYFGERISLTDDLLAVSSIAHKNEPNSFNNHGRVFMYERTGAAWGSLPVATLNPSDRNAFISVSFGRDVQITGTTVFVASHQNVGTSNSKNTVYVYTRPLSGWAGHLTETSQIQNGENGYVYWDMVTDGNYLFLPNVDWTEVAIHRRTGATWDDHMLVQTIVLPAWPGDNWGRSLTVTGSHLVVGLSAGPEVASNLGKMVYYTPNPQWENGWTLNQQFGETSNNASMDEYGKDIAISQQWMAVGAVGDDDRGEYSGAVYLYELSSSGWTQKQKISAHDAVPFIFFGRSVALSPEQLFVGATSQHSYHPGGSIALREAGMVYVYKRIGTTWQFDEVIAPPNPQQGGRFGHEITYANGYVVISEFPENHTGSIGYVHVYKESSAGEWIRIATLTPSDHSITETFGRSIAMNDSIIIVGSGGVQSDIDNFMKAYVFKKKGEWQNATEDARLFPKNQLFNDRFGFSLALYGDQVVVGAPGYSTENHLPENIFQGTAYVFLKPAGGWSGDVHETARLSPSNPSLQGAFGTSVAIDDDDIYVGAPHNYFVWNVVDNFNNDDGKLKPGTVYHYYKKGGWSTTEQEDEQIQSIQPEVKDMFGVSLVLQDGFLFIGALFDDTSVGHNSGSVLTFPQMPLITSIDTPCTEDAPVSLFAIPWGGTWQIEDYPTQTATTIQLPAGSYTASYAVGGCTSATVNFDVISSGRVMKDLSPNTTEKCFYNATSLFARSNAPPDFYSWFYKKMEGDNFMAIKNGVDEISVVEPGYYYVEIKHPVCNPLKGNFQVSNEAVVDIAIDKPLVICSDESIKLIASPEGGVWSSPASAAGDIQPAFLANGEYPIDYTFTTPLGCISTKQETVIIDKLVTPEISSSGTHLCAGQPLSLTLVNKPSAANINWFNSDQPGVSLSSADLLNITGPGSYFVTVSYHSCSLSSFPMLAEPEPDSLFVPNIITPNGDGKNEIFQVYSEGISDMSLILFNRYGDRIFTSRDQSFQWDATDVTAGVYFWYLQITTCNNRRRELKGTVHVVH